MSVIVRETRETQIRVEVRPGDGKARVSTTVPFLDHMLVTFARYSGLDLDVDATGDLRHHIIEDVAITLGQAFGAALPENAARFGDRTIPMDEALIHVAIDTGGRIFYEGPLPSSLYDHWMRSFAEHLKCTLHIRVLRGTDRHHIIEGAFKALGLAIRDAMVEGDAVFSTKGAVRLQRPLPLSVEC